MLGNARGSSGSAVEFSINDSQLINSENAVKCLDHKYTQDIRHKPRYKLDICIFARGLGII